MQLGVADHMSFSYLPETMKDSQSSLESRRQRSGTHSSLGVATGIYLHLGRRSRADLSQKSFTQNPPGVPRTGQEHI